MCMCSAHKSSARCIRVAVYKKTKMYSRWFFLYTYQETPVSGLVQYLTMRDHRGYLEYSTVTRYYNDAYFMLTTCSTVHPRLKIRPPSKSGGSVKKHTYYSIVAMKTKDFDDESYLFADSAPKVFEHIKFTNMLNYSFRRCITSKQMTY